MPVDPNLVGDNQPELTETVPGRSGKRDSLDEFTNRLLETRERAEIIKAFSPAAPVAATVESPIKMVANMDLGAIVGQALSLSHDMMVQNMTNASEAQRQQMADVTANLTKIQERLQNPPQHDAQNPLQAYTQVKGMLDELRKELAPTVGAAAQGPTSDLPTLLAIKKLEFEHQEHVLEFQQQLEQNRQQFQWDMKKWDEERAQEKRQWEAEYGLKLKELETGQNMKEKAGQAIGDLVSALAGSIDGQMAEASGAGVRSVGQVFACENCKSSVSIPQNAQQSQHVKCPACGEDYELTL